MSILPEFDCSKLEGRMREICDGTSGLPEFGPGNTREGYLRLWANKPPVEQPDFSCIHRGPELRTERCKLCGEREAVVPVYECAKFSQCTIHAHGIGIGVSKLAVCIACEDRQCAT